MRKNKVFTMRMSRYLHDLLKRATARDRRSVASLLESLIHAHLTAVGMAPSELAQDERRASPRQKVLFPAQVHVGEGEEKRTMPCVVVDLSRGGVGLVQPRQRERGLASNGGMPRFDLTFDLPLQGRTIRLACVGLHLHETENEIQVGASFAQMGAEDALAISRCLTP